MNAHRSKKTSLARSYPFLVVLFALVSAWFSKANGAEKARVSGPELALEQYLTQAEGENKAITAAKEASEGASLRVGESSLIYSPIFETQALWMEDKRQSAFLSYDRFINNSLDVGISQLTPYGFRGKLSYNLTKTGYVGLGRPIYYYGSPKIELSVDLWRNFFGAETRAQHEALEAAALAAKYQQSYLVKANRARAESAYIQLAAARDLHVMNLSSLERAKDLYGWNAKRSRLNLGEDSDLFQAEANLESIRYAVVSSTDAIRTASRAFNQARGVDSDDVPETLTLPDPRRVKTPDRAPVRDDVRAAQEQQRAISAQAQLGSEKNKPSFEVFGTYARNSQEEQRGEAIERSFDATQPTKAVGVRLRVPLAVGTLRDAQRGYAREKVAAEILSTQRFFDQEIEWKDLSQKLEEAKNRLTFAEKLAAIQRKKTLNERRRLSRGRTTFYQTLIFENDYNQAELQRIRAQSEVLTLIAQMKTFGG